MKDISIPECCRMPYLKIRESRNYIFKKCRFCNVEVARRKHEKNNINNNGFRINW